MVLTQGLSEKKRRGGESGMLAEVEEGGAREEPRFFVTQPTSYTEKIERGGGTKNTMFYPRLPSWAKKFGDRLKMLLERKPEGFFFSTVVVLSAPRNKSQPVYSGRRFSTARPSHVRLSCWLSRRGLLTFVIRGIGVRPSVFQAPLRQGLNSQKTLPRLIAQSPPVPPPPPLFPRALFF